MKTAEKTITGTQANQLAKSEILFFMKAHTQFPMATLLQVNSAMMRKRRGCL